MTATVAARLWLALALAGAAAAAAQPVATVPDCNGVALGSSESQWRAAFPFFACDGGVDLAAADRACAFDATHQRAAAGAPLAFAGVPVREVSARWSLPGGDVQNRHVGATLDRATLTMSVPDYVKVVQRRQLDALKATQKPEPR